MPQAPRQQTRTIGNLSLLVPAPRPPASAVATCLAILQRDWQRDGHLAALWQAWPRIAGPQLAAHCRPLQLQAGLLSVGAAPGPWLQALQYNRHQLLGALRGAGFPVRDIRVQQHHLVPPPSAGSANEAEVWAAHPSRSDVHGMADCPSCGRPAPAGEMGHWGHCSFCRRETLAAQSPRPGTGDGPQGALLSGADSVGAHP
jgi:predicted nucleic acid-binding Zn ribbon protein